MSEPNRQPHLSIVAASRNDDHGGNLFERMQLFVDGLADQARRFDMPTELVLVEWNPPADRPSLAEALRWDPAEQLQPVAASKDVSLTWNCEKGAMVRGDASWIERIVLNLVDNAIKFTPSGGNVKVRVSRDTRNTALEVQDDGIGIPSEALSHIFERFYRADPSRSNRADGAGLGLSLVKWAIDQHRGSVQVDSTPGHGTHVTVQFPNINSN